MIEIKEVNTRKEKKIFANYPLILYKDCPYFVPSLFGDEMAILNPKKNYNLATNKCKAFLAYRDGELVGRIAGLINYKDNELTGKNYIRFSRFDCINDLEVFSALIGAVEKFGKENGMNIIHGPWGFNDTDREGMLTYGFNERSTYATYYNYPYCHENMEKLGFFDESKWIERNFEIPAQMDEKVDRISAKLMEKYSFTDLVKVMSIRKIVKKYGAKFFETFNEAYAHLDGFTPVVGKAQKNVLKQFATIINRRYASILLDKDGDIAGFGIVLPSICDALIKSKGRLFPFGFIRVLKSIRKPKELECALIAVKEKYKNSGINAIIINNVGKHIIEDKIERIESNPMLEHNFNIQAQWKFTSNEIIKKRQTYQKEIV
ncbi:MAG: N-acetyltransferase [Clostridia bacterium]|nr:N-acetyltransferase [Clostridia bacterium]